MRRKTYLGDGVYAEHDGYQVILVTEAVPPGTANKIFVNPDVLASLNAYVAKIEAENELVDLQDLGTAALG